MPRQARTKSEFGIYHVMMRGINRQNIFDDEEDYNHFIRILSSLPFAKNYDGTSCRRHNCTIYAWCLMTNHFHLLVKEQQWTISNIVKHLAGSYVFYYNKKNERVGHLFQERFKSEPCNDEEYFTSLFRYISQNPVKAGIVKNAAEYRWGSWSHDYLAKGDCGAISYVSAMLKKHSLDELKALIDEPCDAKCVDIQNSRRLTDTEVRGMIESVCGAKNIPEFQLLLRDVQDMAVRAVLDAGASVRQVVSHTGLTTKQIRTRYDK